MNDEYAEFFKVFAHVSRAIHLGENTTEILGHIVGNIREILGAKGCIFWIVDHDRRRIGQMVSDGFAYRNLAAVNYDELVAIFDVRDGPFIFIPDARTDRRIPEVDTIGKKSVGSIYGLSLDIVGGKGGILAVYFYSFRELRDRERQIITALGEQGAIALHKSLSYDEKLLQNMRQVVEGLTLALEAKDESTHGHSVRVARFAEVVAGKLGLADAAIETVYHGGLLHDIGKIGMHDDILERLGILSRKEMDVVRQHPLIGERIVAPLRFLDDVVPLIRNHHERFDGSGYPDGLRGSAIPLGARILAVCDAFETMLAGRRHLVPMKLEDIVISFFRGAGHQFDPAIVKALFGVLLDAPDALSLEPNEAVRVCLRQCSNRLTMGDRESQLFI